METEKKKSRKRNYMHHFPSGVNKFYADIKLNMDRLLGFKKLKAQYLSRVGHELNLDSPRSFNEKTIWKKIYDRNPLLVRTADKYAVRSYVTDVLGDQEAEKILIPLYYVTDTPESIPFGTLPDDFVVKPNHGSQMHLIVKGKNKITAEQIIKKCREWLKIDYGLYGHEWAYRNIPKKIIVEKLLQTRSGGLPDDFKLYCFHGKCRLIRVSQNRFSDGELSAYFDLDWNMLPVHNPGYELTKTPFKKPSGLGRIISLSEKLSEKFDAVRVDLYNLEGETYLGELTHYDASGMARFEPESFDYELGSFWETTRNYWKQ